MIEMKKIIMTLGTQVLRIYGLVMLLFTVIRFVVGDSAQEISTLFQAAENGFSGSALLQILLLSVMIAIGQMIFLSEEGVKDLSIVNRLICFFILIFATIIVFAILFDWFPIYDVKSWICFILSFGICMAVTVFVTGHHEKNENEKMAEALEKLKQDGEEFML